MENSKIFIIISGHLFIYSFDVPFLGITRLRLKAKNNILFTYLYSAKIEIISIFYFEKSYLKGNISRVKIMK